jgi:hypothetical protein
VFSLSYDQQILKGWYNRPADWQIGATIQHEILPRISVEASYLRRWLQNFTVTDNLAVSSSDFTEFSVTAPLDPRLPNGGGYVVSGLYNVNNDKFGQTNNYRTYSPAYGDISMIYNGVDVDTCAVRSLLPEQVSTGASSQGGIPYDPANPYCHVAPGITTRLTAAGTYTVPKIDVQIAATLTSSPGIPLRADWQVPSAEAAKSLGRPLSGNLPNVSVNLLAPDAMQHDRVNILDLRFGKVLRFGSNRALIALDLYNAPNFDTVLSYAVNNVVTYVPNGRWLVPNSVLTARTAKLTVQYDF